MRQTRNNEKLAAAGFTILRTDDNPYPRIKVWKSDSAWITLEKFSTKAARDRRMEELLQDPKTIVDV